MNWISAGCFTGAVIVLPQGIAFATLAGLLYNLAGFEVPAPLAAFLGIFQVLFGARGVSLDKPVVVYDHESGERAARAVWMRS